MNIVMKMKRDWDRRARHDARFWIATEDYRDEGTFAASGEKTRSALRALLGEHYDPSWRVLEVGCGVGRVLRPLARDFARLYGVDVSREMIGRAREWLAGLENVRVFENSGVDLSRFADGSIDLAYSWIAFQHMPRPVFDAYLAEINRVLVPGGLLACQLVVGIHADPAFADTVSLRVYPPADLRMRLAGAGFTLLSEIPITDSQKPCANATVLARRHGGVQSARAEDWQRRECADVVSPLDDHLHLELARDYVSRGEIPGAIIALRDLVQGNPKHLIGWTQLATLLVESHQLDDAIAALQSMVRANPGFEPARERLAEIRRFMTASHG